MAPEWLAKLVFALEQTPYQMCALTSDKAGDKKRSKINSHFHVFPIRLCIKLWLKAVNLS